MRALSIGVILIGVGVIFIGAVLWWGMETNVSRTGPILTDYAIVKISGPIEATSIAVTDPGGDGWHREQRGFGTGTIELTLEELSGKEVCITSTGWILYDARGSVVSSGTSPVQKTVSPYGSMSIELDIVLGESAAVQIDNVASIVNDYSGSGTLTFSVAGRDTVNGLPVTSIEGCADIAVTKA